MLYYIVEKLFLYSIQKMIFTNTRTIDTSKKQSQTSPEYHLIGRAQNRPIRVRPQVVTSKVNLARKPTTTSTRKIKWGEPFWNLFHVLSEKIIEDDRFEQKKIEFLNLVVLICRNLPCPDCAHHATQYLNGMNFNIIKTKQDLKMMFFNFHNHVNFRRGVSPYPLQELDTKYSKGNTVNIIHAFMIQFENKHRTVHMLSNDFHRSGISVNLKKWFNDNITCFTP